MCNQAYFEKQIALIAGVSATTFSYICKCACAKDPSAMGVEREPQASGPSKRPAFKCPCTVTVHGNRLVGKVRRFTAVERGKRAAE